MNGSSAVHYYKLLYLPKTLLLIDGRYRDLPYATQPLFSQQKDGAITLSSRTTEANRMLHQRLAARLRCARLHAGLTQTQAARVLQVSYQQYNKYELTLNRISAVSLQNLALAFNTPLEWFFDHDPSIKSPEKKPLDVSITNLFNAIEDRSDQCILLDLAVRLAAKPRLTKPNDMASAVSQVQQSLVAAKHILLVDDDIDTLCVTGALLRKAGFDITTASSGDQALRHLANTEVVFDALVTDYSMPGLSGLALIELALEKSPGLPTMVITGYHRDPSLGQLPPKIRILSKPYSTNLFLAYVKNLSTRLEESEVKTSSIKV